MTHFVYDRMLECGVIEYILECLFCHGGYKNERSIAVNKIRDLQQSCEEGKLKCRDDLQLPMRSASYVFFYLWTDTY